MKKQGKAMVQIIPQISVEHTKYNIKKTTFIYILLKT
jgi:hypothetical protein